MYISFLGFYDKKFNILLLTMPSLQKKGVFCKKLRLRMRPILTILNVQTVH